MVILSLKVLKLSNRGSLTIISPLAFAGGLLFFEKEGFFKTFVVLVLGRRELEKK
jgi:hypothetical protein